jgi:predicted enzyme related to lactoylglutathione lyase
MGRRHVLRDLGAREAGHAVRRPEGHPWPLRCDDVAEVRAELEAKGVQFLGDTFDTGVCHMAIFADPDGNELMLHRRYAP